MNIVCSSEDNEFITFYMGTEQYNLKFSQYEVEENSDNKTVYLKVLGKYSFGDTCSRFYRTFDIDEALEKICIEDKRGNVKEIWNKKQGILVTERCTI